MFKKTLYISYLIIVLLLLSIQPSQAFWVWTSDSKKWENPKYSVKGTPQEQLEIGKQYLKDKKYKMARRAFKKLIKHYPKARQAPEAQFHIGEIFDEQGKTFEAFKQYQLVIDKYPFSERSAQIVKKQYEIGNQLLDGREDRNKFIESLSGADYNIIEVFKKVIKNAPYGELAAPSQYKIGLYLQEKGLLQEARDEFEKVVNDYPDSEWAKAANYQIAVTDSKRSAGAQYDQKITKAAVDEFKDFLERYPDAELSEDAKGEVFKLKEKEAANNLVVAQFYEKQKNYTAAKVYYQIIVEDYANTPYASGALQKIREMNELENSK